jgi:protein gp37
MAACAQHSFLVLTKRIERADDFMQYYACPNNVWIGTTVESQHNVRRMEILLAIDATRWLSCEPLLSELILPDTRDREIAFVACAEESGPGARPAKIEWFHKLRDWCRINGTHFFYKGKAFPELRRYNSLPYTLGTKCCERSANG